VDQTEIIRVYCLLPPVFDLPGEGLIPTLTGWGRR